MTAAETICSYAHNAATKWQNTCCI